MSGQNNNPYIMSTINNNTDNMYGNNMGYQGGNQGFQQQQQQLEPQKKERLRLKMTPEEKYNI